VQTYLLCLEPVSQVANRKGILELGPVNLTVPIFEDRMDSKSLFLTANNNTPYTWFWLDLHEGPLVLEVPPKVLGAINDMWYNFVTDLCFSGADKGEGGKYLILPPGCERDVPDGYFVVRPATYSVWVPWRSFLVDGDPKPGVDLVEKHTKIYHLKDAANPPALRFVHLSGRAFSTLAPADYSFWEYLNQVVQEEPTDVLDPVTLGLYASVGIQKGKPFSPDGRMKKILSEAAVVGISLDGPKEVHDRYRRDRSGSGTFDRVMRGLKLLQKHEVEYNVLACVARETAKRPLDVYRFFKGEGVEFIQFTPVVEGLSNACSAPSGLRLAGPAALDQEDRKGDVTAWSVNPEDYGDFLIAIYEEWVRQDVGKVFVMNFEWALNVWIGNPSPVCVHSVQCGRSLVLEHNGDVYACDHCVYPEYRLGDIRTAKLSEMIERSLQSGFGVSKETALPRLCRECDVLAACRGGCPKHRFMKTYLGKPRLPYLCPGYKKFFRHIRKYLRAIAQLIENGLPASYVMEAVKGPLVIKLDQVR